MLTLQRLRSAFSIKHQQISWSLLRCLDRIGLSDRAFLPLCGWLWLFAGKTDESFRDFAAFGRCHSLPMGFLVWCRFRILRGVANGCVLRFRLWIKDEARPRIEVDGRELMDAAKVAQRGVLVLTYHHHFNAMFCAALGRHFGTVYVFAKNPEESPLYHPLRHIADCLYAGSEAFFNGGEYLYVNSGKSFNSRTAITAFRRRAMVVSVHDFPTANQNKMSGLFLNPAVGYPTGAIDYALRKNIPILFGFLVWQGGGRFRLCLRPCAETADTHTVLASYFEVIEREFFGAPERWEYWRTVCAK